MPNHSIQRQSTSLIFDTIFAHTRQNCILIMNSRGIIQAVNPAFCACFGYEEPDIIGKSAEILFTLEDRILGLPEKELSRVLTEGQADDNNYLVHKDETITWVSGESIRIEENGNYFIVKIIQNINQQKTMADSLESLVEFNERILSSIDDVVMVVDDQMNIVRVNKAFATMFETRTEIPKPYNVPELIRNIDHIYGLSEKMHSVLHTGQPASSNDVEIRVSSGEKRIFDISCRAIESPSGDNNLLIVLHDKTLAHQVERQREDIIGFVAHELRNPLANIVLSNELLSDILTEKGMTEPLSFLKRSQNNVSRLTKMITELYDATKVSSGHLQLEYSWFNFEDMIAEAAEATNALHPNNMILVKGEANIMVYADKNKIIQVVSNYLSNGIKYSKDQTSVVLEMTHNELNVTVSVTDNGLGIPHEQIPFIFNRFFRAEKTRNLEGIGLGLYLCRQIIKAHNGRVWVESREGEGSTFYFFIPINAGTTS